MCLPVKLEARLVCREADLRLSAAKPAKGFLSQPHRGSIAHCGFLWCSRAIAVAVSAAAACRVSKCALVQAVNALLQLLKLQQMQACVNMLFCLMRNSSRDEEQLVRARLIPDARAAEAVVADQKRARHRLLFPFLDCRGSALSLTGAGSPSRLP